MNDEIVVRRAQRGDLARVAQLAGALVRMHHDVDPSRFLLVENVEDGYARWFERQLASDEAVILVASRGPTLVGYAYGTLEDRNWNLLLDEHGAVHDVFVVPEARREGAGRKLIAELVAALERLGAPRIVLSTMVGNEAAQRLFRQCGFRPTMLEMTRSREASKEC